MSVLRLTSSTTQQEVVIMKRFIEGYWLQANGDFITLFTPSQPLEIANSDRNSWDNWDEFIKGVKLRFDDQDTFF